MFNKFILISFVLELIFCGEYGIDVSEYQGKIDFNQVKNSGIDFVIIRGGYGNTTDSYFESNYINAKL